MNFKFDENKKMIKFWFSLCFCVSIIIYYIWLWDFFFHGESPFVFRKQEKWMSEKERKREGEWEWERWGGKAQGYLEIVFLTHSWDSAWISWGKGERLKEPDNFFLLSIIIIIPNIGLGFITIYIYMHACSINTWVPNVYSTPRWWNTWILVLVPLFLVLWFHSSLIEKCSSTGK